MTWHGQGVSVTGASGAFSHSSMAAGVTMRVAPCRFKASRPLSPVTRNAASLAAASASRNVKGRGKKLCIASAQSCAEERPLEDFAEFREEVIGNDQREPFLLPGGEQLGRRATGRELGGEQDVGVEDEAHQVRVARRRYRSARTASTASSISFRSWSSGTSAKRSRAAPTVW
jgi:hypothetical protein